MHLEKYTYVYEIPMSILLGYGTSWLDVFYVLQF